ncbi:DUF4157 domain-containing protein [Undibacterium sp. TJN19]|uniref:eCIS core domain-containing protein n=1 Tax=Undibacterium sp. TJN19 TaxID=3413055 RepID=UPI003BF1CFB4
MKSSHPAQRERLQPAPRTAQASQVGPATAQRLVQPTGFSDQRPAMQAQRQRQQIADNSPQARQLQTVRARMDGQSVPVLQQARDEELQGKFEAGADAESIQKREVAPAIQAKPVNEQAAQTPAKTPVQTPITTRNNTGLPNQLKAGVESLSGVSLDAVKVHYNSAQPAQLNAHAYAQGTDIHIGPGQEKHLPHEAWHVVQQAQGRVRPTMQMKAGVAINDDSGLESEADVMGARALDHGAQVVQQMAQGGAAASGFTSASMIMAGGASDAPVQRDVYPHRNQATDVVDQTKIDNAAKIAEHVWQIVKRVRPIALDWRQFKTYDGYLGNWYKNANAQYEMGSDGQVSFLHASFGYAVETLACEQLNPQEFGLNVRLQVASGATRPDIEIRDDAKNIVSWQDITTEAELNHIGKKSGSGWSTHPYVCEILYPSLERDDVFTSSDHPFFSKEGQMISSKMQNREQAKEQVKVDMQGFFHGLQEEDGQFTGPGGNQSKKQSVIKKKVKEEFGDDFGGNKINHTVKSSLNELGFNPGHFGFGKGGQSIGHFSSYVNETAQPDIEKRDTSLYNNQFGQISQSLHSYQHTPFLTGFNQDWQQATDNREKEEQVRKSQLRQAVLEVYQQLQSAYGELQRMHGVHGRDLMLGHMVRHILAARFDDDIDFGVAWIDKARELIRWLDTIKEEYGPEVKPVFHFGGNDGKGGGGQGQGGSQVQGMDLDSGD